MTQRPYRGKRIDNGAWVEGSHVRQELAEKEYILTEEAYLESPYTPSYFTYHEVDPETVGQYTGRKTFDEKPVFKGDKLQFVTFNHDGSDNGVQMGYVDWDEEASAFVVVDSDDGDKSYWLYLVFENDESVEIIGNIHDHPHLLKG